MSGDAAGGPLDGRLSADQVREEGKERGDRNPAAPEESGSPLKEWIELLVRAGFWALLIYTFLFQVSVVRGSSMEPNFHDGDRLLIDKLTYRFSEPQVGDVVVFEAVVNKEGRRVHRDYIKRIAARPGQAVRVRQGVVYVNGQRLEEPWEPDAGPSSRDGDLEYLVPPGRYFVLGDRRWDSEDSRGEFTAGGAVRSKIGFVPEGQIKGKVRWRFWPFDRLNWF